MQKRPNFPKTRQTKTIVLTGGPGVGKTSIIQQLQKMNYEVREEVFTKIFADAQKSGRFDENFLNSQQLVHELISAQKILESQPTDQNFLFLDRSRIDILGFSGMRGVIPFPEDQIELESGNYALFFIIEPLPMKYYDQNSIRRQDFQESMEHHIKGVENYIQYIQRKKRDPETCLIRVPFFDLPPNISVQKRTQFILDEITSRLQI